MAVGSLFVPVREILPAFLPLNVALSAYLVLRYRDRIDSRFLLSRLLPFMALGLPLGLLAFARLSESGLERALGTFVVVLSILELLPRRNPSPRALPKAAEIGLGVLGGAIHGAFAMGGPVAVYVVGRAIEDKGTFRSTLSLLWLVLNSVLLGSYALDGRFDSSAIERSVALIPALGLGMVIGEVVHRRVPATQFQTGVFAALAIAGVVLIGRA